MCVCVCVCSGNRQLPLTPFISTAGVTSGPLHCPHKCACTHAHTHINQHTHIHRHTHRGVSVRGGVWGDLELLTENKRVNQEKMQPLRITFTTMRRKNPRPHSQKRKENLVSLFQSSRKCLTKAQIENIFVKRLQAPFIKKDLTPRNV